MGEKMTLAEAVEKAEDNETILNSYFFPTIKRRKKFIASTKITVAQALDKSWEVIRAEPKVLTADEWLDLVDFDNPESESTGIAYFTRSELRSSFNEIHKNGRLERDLEFRSLLRALYDQIESVDSTNNAPDSPGYEKLKKELENLKPLNKND